jgi:hypothetical protein
MRRHAEAGQRKCDPARPNSELKCRAFTSEPGQELNGGIDILGRELLTGRVECVVVVPRGNAFVEVAVFAQAPNLQQLLPGVGRARSNRRSDAPVFRNDA